MERLEKPRDGREDRGLSERKVSEIKSGNGTDGYRCGILRLLPRRRNPLRTTIVLFRRGECLIQPRLATIGGVPMNDPVLSRFVDSRNRRANLIGGALWS
jgi:hypothetical protein